MLPISNLLRKTFRNVCNSTSRKFRSADLDPNIGRTNISIRFFRQVERGEKLTGTQPPPLIVSAMRSRIGWRILMTCPDGIVRKYRSLTWLGAIRKAERIWREKAWLEVL